MRGSVIRCRGQPCGCAPAPLLAATAKNVSGLEATGSRSVLGGGGSAGRLLLLLCSVHCLTSLRMRASTKETRVPGMCLAF